MGDNCRSGGVHLNSNFSEYNPMEQRMSELALGKFGFLMFWAFISLSLSIFALSLGLQQYHPPVIFRVLLTASSICLLGGGIFRLDKAPNTHITMVSIAFVLLVLVMYLMPQNLNGFNASKYKIISWVSGTGTAVFIALGQNIIPMGISQRGAALFILFWLIWVSSNLKDGKVNVDS
jgi:hypothetical protein